MDWSRLPRKEFLIGAVKKYLYPLLAVAIGELIRIHPKGVAGEESSRDYLKRMGIEGEIAYQM